MEWSVAWHPRLLADGRPFVSVDGLLEAVAHRHRATDSTAADILERHLHDEFSDHDHTFAEQLGLLSALRNRLARQLEDWTAGRRSVLGHGPVVDDADLVDALLRSKELRHSSLLEELSATGGRLRSALIGLTDDHLRATVHHVVRGREPLAAFLTRSALDDEIDRHIELLRTLRDLAPDTGHPRSQRDTVRSGPDDEEAAR
jgi:hypothetical protein